MLTLLLSIVSVGAVAFDSNGLKFETIDDTSVRVTGYVGDESVTDHLEIPSQVVYAARSYKVTGIGERAFEWKNLKTVSIPEGIETIAEYAFLGTALQEVKLPQTLKSMGESAFSGCDLISVNLPAGLAKDENAYPPTYFFGAGGSDNTIEDIVIEQSDSELDAKIATCCSNLTVRRHWSGTCPGVKYNMAFEGQEIIIDVDCFRDFDIFPVNINITGGNVLFQNSKYRSVYKGEGVFENTSIIDDAYTGTYEFKRIDRMAAIPYNTGSIKINCNSLKSGNRTFSNFKNITSFEANAAEIEVEQGTFANCENLASIDLTPFSGVHCGMFQNCKGLKKITVTPGCRYINGMAFIGCSSLKEVEIKGGDSPVIIGAGVFKQIPLEELTLDRNFVAGDSPFYNVKTLAKLTLGENITELPDFAFAGCSSLKEIYCESSTPPVIHPNTFKDVSRTDCKVFVRTNEQDYKEFDGWMEFFGAVEDVAADNCGIIVASSGGELNVSGLSATLVGVYDFQGNEIVRPLEATGEVSFPLPPGNYIVVAGDKTFKHFHR